MDQKYLNTLRQNIAFALRKAEADLYHDNAIDFSPVFDQVKIFQDYLNNHMPKNPSDDLKTLVHDVFHSVQILSDRIAEEVKLSKMRLAEMRSTQKVTMTYTYGMRK